MVVNNKQLQTQEDAKEEVHFKGLATNSLLAHDREYTSRMHDVGGGQQLSSLKDGSTYDLNGP
jgi:hypothetical protein